MKSDQTSPKGFTTLSIGPRLDIFNRDALTGHLGAPTWALLSSCRRDIMLALRLCRGAESRQSELTAIVLSLQVAFDSLRFAVHGAIVRPLMADHTAHVNMMN
jgi:hypothetical protein